jgi:hypothetical protein
VDVSAHADPTRHRGPDRAEAVALAGLAAGAVLVAALVVGLWLAGMT